MADQQLIEIAKALSIDARVLILDEPTASLSAHEVERLFTIVRRTSRTRRGDPVRQPPPEEVFELCDRATVFRDGRHVITAPTRELTTGDLVRHMVGRAVTLFPKGEAAIGDVLLEVRDLTRIGEFRDVSFSVRAGEIVGLAGLVGAGRTEIARVLFGIDAADGRRGAASTASPSASGPRRRRCAPGIAYVPEDRHQDGLVLDFSIAENVTLPILPRLFPRLVRRRATERALAAGYTERLQRPDDRRGPARRRPSRAATSRRWSSPSGWRPSRACSSSTSRPAASTSAPRSRSTASSPNSPPPGSGSS